MLMRMANARVAGSMVDHSLLLMCGAGEDRFAVS